MKQLLGTLILLAAALHATPLITIPQADLTALPGQQVSWGVTVSNPGQYVTFTSTFPLTETNPALGSYFDMMGTAGGPVGAVLPPGANWQTDLGSYSIDPAALAGTSNTLLIRVLWEEYSDNPYFCTNCFAGAGFSDHTVSVSVGTVPEPGTATLFLLAGTGLALLRFRRR